MNTMFTQKCMILVEMHSVQYVVCKSISTSVAVYNNFAPLYWNGIHFILEEIYIIQLQVFTYNLWCSSTQYGKLSHELVVYFHNYTIDPSLNLNIYSAPPN